MRENLTSKVNKGFGDQHTNLFQLYFLFLLNIKYPPTWIAVETFSELPLGVGASGKLPSLSAVAHSVATLLTYIGYCKTLKFKWEMFSVALKTFMHDKLQLKDGTSMLQT